MGKGDIKTKKGKRRAGSSGVSRLKKKVKPIIEAKPKKKKATTKTAKKTTPKAKKTTAEKPKKAAAKKTTEKED